LSRFLRDSEPSTGISSQNPKPGFAQLPVIWLCIEDLILAPIIPIAIGMYRDCCASAHLQKFCTMTRFLPLSNLVPRSHLFTIKLVPSADSYRQAKSTPYLSCHRDLLPAKVPGSVAGWLRQVPQPTFIAGPLGTIGKLSARPIHEIRLIFITLYQ
jgi:hypothetical protein